VQRFGDRGCAHSAAQTGLTKSGASGQQQIQIQDFATDTPTLENTFVARLREIKGDSSGVNYPGFTEQPDGTAIGAQNLSKVFGNFRAVNQINLDIKYGGSLVFGANGAGKTTTIKMLRLAPS